MPLVREIKFDGYVFRSKIEAQWYKLFQELGVECYYENETFSLAIGDKTVNYLPDFFLPEQDCFVEIKLAQKPLPVECCKCFALAQQTGRDVYLFYEVIGKKNTNGYLYKGGSGAFMPLQRLTQCPICKHVAFTRQGLVGSAHMQCGCHCKELPNTEAVAIARAVGAVRAERFGA
jgi:hypothetical protein